MRRDKLIQEYQHDPYFAKGNNRDPSLCKGCGVAYLRGQFRWEEPPAGASEMECPACQRIRDGYEGGVVSLAGAFVAGHREEILNLVHNTEKLEKQHRPLERLMAVSENGTIEVSTTYEHLARRIGEAVHRAYKGDLRMDYPKGEKFVRVHWQRD